MKFGSGDSKDSIDYQKEVLRRDEEIQSLTEISMALSQERDRNKLLREILTRVRHLTHSDGGALFVISAIPGFKVEHDSQEPLDGKRLIFKIVQNDTLPSVARDFKEQALEINEQSLVGYCALHQQVLNIEDAYQLKPEAPYCHDRSWDQRNDYRTKSLLVVPMVGTKGELLGVIELINRKAERKSKLGSVFSTASEVRPYDETTEKFAMALAGQAAIALENVNLYSNIENLFKEFIHASVRAIEARDPTTSGHSFRVAQLTVELAKATSDVSVGAYKDLSLTSQTLKEIEYASLLHDFGKISVPSEVLVKAKKLYPSDFKLLCQRIEWLRAEFRLLASEKKFERLKNGQPYDDVEQELEQVLAEIKSYEKLVIRSNEPSIVEDGDFERLESFKNRTLLNSQKVEIPFLTHEECNFLSLRRGTLTADERTQIESHVSHTFEFLKTIPWTQDLKQVANIAFSHHEKLNGKGYPRGLSSDQIPFQARMMTIADIFDALTARDRPYKKACPLDKSLEILQSEVDDGALDPELFRIFKERKIYNLIPTHHKS